MKILESKSDFEWYRNTLDCQLKYRHAHYGEPERYPCAVDSVWEYYSGSAYGGRDMYHHTFIYKKNNVCKECGHKSDDWPERVSQFLKG